jgi:hypothetical protein
MKLNNASKTLHYLGWLHTRYLCLAHFLAIRYVRGMQEICRESLLGPDGASMTTKKSTQELVHNNTTRAGWGGLKVGNAQP